MKTIKLHLKLLVWKLKKTGCWSRFIVIRDFFIEMKYYTIQNIWKEIGKLNFVIIGIAMAAILKFFFCQFFYNITKYDYAKFHVKSIFLSEFTQGMIRQKYPRAYRVKNDKYNTVK